ncbi:response regulator [bacterium]|nr:response regulator [bacterium]
MTKTAVKQPVRIHYFQYGLIFAICYWAMEAVQDVISFDRGDFVERFFIPDSGSLWMRVVVVGIILLFGTVSDILSQNGRAIRKRLWIRGEWGLMAVCIGFSVIYWLLEAFRDFYIFQSGSFVEMIYAPPAFHFWIRVLAVFFLILFGIYVQTNVNELRSDGKQLRHQKAHLERLVQSRSLELTEAKSLIQRLRNEIDRRQLLEKEIASMRDQLIHAQKLEAVGLISGGIAHDFNNLMTAVLGVSSLAMKDIPENSSLYHDMQQIRTAAGRAADLTRQLLLFSRENPAEFAPLNLNTVIRGLNKMLLSIIGEDITLTFDLAEDCQPVKGDKGTLEQVIINLVVNSRDSIRSGGNILVATRDVSLDQRTDRHGIQIHPGQYTRLIVKDNGIGMTAEIRNRIFDPFFSTKPPEAGTGLGLAVVDQIVSKHEGWIEVDSNPGSGTVFSVFLPIITGRVQSRPEDMERVEHHQGHGRRILLIEDEDNVREFTYRALSQQGYNIITAGTADEAKRVFYRESGAFDLILSDVVLPDENGVDLVLNLTSDYPNVPVLLCSGHTDSKAQWLRIKKHGFPFLKKPFALNDLLKGVHHAVDNFHGIQGH